MCPREPFCWKSQAQDFAQCALGTALSFEPWQPRAGWFFPSCLHFCPATLNTQVREACPLPQVPQFPCRCQKLKTAPPLSSHGLETLSTLCTPRLLTRVLKVWLFLTSISPHSQLCTVDGLFPLQ